MAVDERRESCFSSTRVHAGREARLDAVRAPTLLIVGGRDHVFLDLNRRALAKPRCPADLVVVPGATHLFEEPGALGAAASMARGRLRKPGGSESIDT